MSDIGERPPLDLFPAPPPFLVEPMPNEQRRQTTIQESCVSRGRGREFIELEA